MKMTKHKKGLGFTDLAPIVAGFMFIIIMLAIGSIIVTRVSKEETLWTDAVIINETWSTDGTTYVNLEHANILNNSETLYNTSAGVCVRLTNYTMDYFDGQIKCVSASGECCNEGDMNISYTWRYYGAGYNATQSGAEAILNISEQMSILALIIVMSIVISAVALYVWKQF